MDHYPDPLRDLAAFNTSPRNRASVTQSDAAVQLRQSPMMRELVEDATLALSSERDDLRRDSNLLRAELGELDRRHVTTLGVLSKYARDLDTLQGAGFWTRVKWLFTGVTL